VEERAYSELEAQEEHHWWFRGRRAVLEALLARAGVGPRPRLLDAGCGTGGNLVAFGSLGPAVGVDPSPRAVAACRARGLTNVQQSSLESLPFQDAAFDLVLMTDVLEHIADDTAALRELHRVAAPGATLILTVPAYQWLWSPHDVEMHHQRRYTRPGLLRRLRASAWDPRLATYFNSLLLPPIAAVRTVQRIRPTGASASDVDRSAGGAARVLEWPMRIEAAAIRRGGRFGAGVSIGVVATPRGHEDLESFAP
jgi:SAM-dependent methyltransferase